MGCFELPGCTCPGSRSHHWDMSGLGDTFPQPRAVMLTWKDLKDAYPQQIKVCLVFATGCSCFQMPLHNVSSPVVWNLTLTTL